MEHTPRLGLPFIAPQQAQKQVTYNDAMRALDVLVQPAVTSRSVATPPGSPANGDTYIVAASSTGAWTGKANTIATWDDGAWDFRTPADGWLAYVADGTEIVICQAGAWQPFVTNGGDAVAKFGINTSADLTNRLAVAADASLFTHDGDSHRLKVNKSAAGDTASLLFQTSYSGRAEMGLAGDDDFAVKVSADGSAWHDALKIARATGAVTLSAGQLVFPATQNASADPHALDDYEEGTWTPALKFGGASTGIAYGTQAGRYTKIGRLVLVSGGIVLTSKGSATGAAAIEGLPFSPEVTPGSSLSVGFANSLTLTGQIVGLVAASPARAVLYASLNGSSTALTDTNFGNTSALSFSAVYEAV